MIVQGDHTSLKLSQNGIKWFKKWLKSSPEMIFKWFQNCQKVFKNDLRIVQNGLKWFKSKSKGPKMTLNSTKLLQMWPKSNSEMILKCFKNGL